MRKAESAINKKMAPTYHSGKGQNIETRAFYVMYPNSNAPPLAASSMYCCSLYIYYRYNYYKKNIYTGRVIIINIFILLR